MQSRHRSSFLWACAVALGLSWAGGAIASERSDWKEAQKLDTIAGYERFLAARPKSNHLQTAFDRLEQLRYEAALSANTLEAWADYVAKYPRKEAGPRDYWYYGYRHREEALGALAQARQRQALAEGSFEAAKRFYEEYRNGGHGTADMRQLQYELAAAQGTWEAFQLFAKIYPKHELTDRLRHTVMVKQFDAKPTIGGAEAYLYQYPQGEHAARVASWMNSTLDADPSVRRVGNLRMRWVDGEIRESLQVSTGEMALVRGDIKPVYVTRRPKRGLFLTARILLFNTGPAARLEKSGVTLGGAPGARFAAETVDEIIGRITRVVTDADWLSIKGPTAIVEATFDVPKAGWKQLTLFVSGERGLALGTLPIKD